MTTETKTEFHLEVLHREKSARRAYWQRKSVDTAIRYHGPTKSLGGAISAGKRALADKTWGYNSAFRIVKRVTKVTETVVQVGDAS